MKKVLLILLPLLLFAFSYQANGQITGTTVICEGSSSSLTGSPGGGTWSSSTASVATVNSFGVVSGIAHGTATITYTPPSATPITAVITVNSSPLPVSGPATVCVSSTITLSDSPSGGLWTSSNMAIAIVGPTSGVVSGIGEGAVDISYTTSGGCSAIKTVIVTAAPPAITGPSNICTGTTTTLSDAASGGTWTSTNPSISINATTGDVTGGFTPGTTTISYTTSTGCVVTTTFTVSAMPSPVIGSSNMCSSSSSIFSCASSGGIWYSSAPSVATITSTSGSTVVVNALTAGVAYINYATGPGCASSILVTVSPAPVAGSLSGPSVICIGAPAALTATVTGGVWTSSAPGIASVSGIGVVTGFGTGAATISYTISNSCGTDYAIMPVSINLPPSPITGPTTVCGGSGGTFTDAVPSGTWSSSDVSVASIGSSSGIMTSILTGGVAIISYSFSSACYITKTITINPNPPAIGGVMPLCLGGVIALTDDLFGGTWSSSNPAVAVISTIGGTTGTVTGLGVGTCIITYGMGTGCMATATITVNPLPAITASAIPASCDGGYLGFAGGGVSYMWEPTDGLSCSTCASPTINPSVTTTYTVSGTGVLGCTSDATVTVNADRVNGHIYFSGPAPASLGVQVWLLQYSPADSSLIAIDSMLTCGAIPYFEFDSKPAGSYMVRASLVSSIPGTSNYIPTYGGSSAYWNAATTVVHTGETGNRDITMMYGTVPSGGGSINGTIYSGSGSSTTGDVPLAGTLVFLKDATTGQILTYAYTDALGAYSFSGIAFGTYVIYPEYFSYYTTQSGVISLDESAPSKSGVNFKQYTTLGIIAPLDVNAVNSVPNNELLNIYPNPASGMLNLQWANQKTGNVTFTLADVTGAEILKKNIQIDVQSGRARIDISAIPNGIYFFNVSSETINYSGKVLVQQQ